MREARIIDYGMGNLGSVANAVEAAGGRPVLVRTPGELRGADRIILPGVGAFGDGARNLRERGWIEAMSEEALVKGRPFLGVCLGMQLLASRGTEHGRHEGLGWIPGECRRFELTGLRVPHVGWNSVRFRAGSKLFAGLGEAADFYFVHSFVFHPEDPGLVSGTCDYGGDFCAALERDNIHAAQFHPEKSHRAGLAVLKNFLAI